MISELYDMDKQEKIRYVSESSNASTSGYSTMSPGSVMGAPNSVCGLGGGGNVSPSSSNNTQYSLSPAPSPGTATLHSEFSNLNLPSSNSPQRLSQRMQQNLPNHQYFNQLQSETGALAAGISPPMSHLSANNMYMMDHVYFTSTSTNLNTIQFAAGGSVSAAGHGMFGGKLQTQKSNNSSKMDPCLHISEQPVDKFRFRYKSEMHGTHGSLNGANSKRTPKTFPEVELLNYNGPAVIRCSLFQTNLDSPHSHQLVVRKEERDVCDPHDLHVSSERGYVAQFINMGIIHTAKKFIFDELFKKKQERLVFQMGRRELSTKQIQELHKETDKEAKDMNLNQVRLCFEAFKIEANNVWIPIAKPVYTNPINNRKSAQTGELRIVRLSIAAGSVSGNDELILLVEKVSKKNIKVRFYEQNEDDETVWEAYGKFRESDVHHQYAIVCQTPPYKDKEIDRQIEVSIELIRPSDDERSFPPLPFRYKPRDAVVSRKRRRTCSTATSSSGTGSAASSLELPKPVEEQADQLAMGTCIFNQSVVPTISEEYNKDDHLKELIGSENFELINADSENLMNYCQRLQPFSDIDELMSFGEVQKDGASTASSTTELRRSKQLLNLLETDMLQLKNASSSSHECLKQIFRIYDGIRSSNLASVEMQQQYAACCKNVEQLYIRHADTNFHGDTLLHEVISQKKDGIKLAIRIIQILTYFRLQTLMTGGLNADNQSVLHCACLHDCEPYIRSLLKLGCNPNLQDKCGNTALHIAVKEEHIECIQSLLQTNQIKLDLTLKNDEGLSPLHIAIRQNNFDVAKKLIKYDRNAIHVSNTKNGNNALHMAVVQQTRDLVVLILDAQNMEQDVLIARNAAGYTALDLAKQLAGNQQTHNEIVQILEPFYKPLAMYLIKIKEELESSSTEDEEDSNELMDQCSGNDNSVDELLEVKTEVTIESEVIGNAASEFTDFDSSGTPSDGSKVTQDLAMLLNDTQKFKALIQLLEQPIGSEPNWKRLAQKSKMHHLVFLWKNAEAMLNYVKTKSSDIEYRSFARALAEVDLKALHLLQRN